MKTDNFETVGIANIVENWLEDLREPFEVLKKDVQKLEFESRDGFMANSFNHGGRDLLLFSDVSHLVGSGNVGKSGALETYNAALNDLREDMRRTFIKEFEGNAQYAATTSNGETVATFRDHSDAETYIKDKPRLAVEVCSILNGLDSVETLLDAYDALNPNDSIDDYCSDASLGICWRVRIMYCGNNTLRVFAGYDNDAPYYRWRCVGAFDAGDIVFTSPEDLKAKLNAITSQVEDTQ